MCNQGSYRMIRDLAGAWQVFDPWGGHVDTSGCQSQGLQVAINHAINDGFPLKVLGGPQVGNGDGGRITCQIPLYIPPSTKANFEFSGVSLWFPNARSDDGIVFDSFDMLHFYFTGQIIYPGNSAAVKIRPANIFHEGNDPFRVATSSRLYFQTIAIVNPQTMYPERTHGTGIIIDPAAPVTFNTIKVDELNGGYRRFWVAPKSNGGYFDAYKNSVKIAFPH